MSECQTHTLIHVRRDERYGYAVEVHCETHDAEWICLCGTLSDAEQIINTFPLVKGGITSCKDARVPDPDCMLTGIDNRWRRQ